jgi:hypothetical protein
MRQFHPTAFHEQFVASGTYTYQQNGEPTGITEAWTIHLLPDNSRLIRVDYDGRTADSGRSILLEALCDEAGNIQRFDTRLYDPKSESVKQAKASYIIFTDHVQVGRHVNDQPRLDEESAISPDTVIYPLMHIFTGGVIRRVTALGGSAIPVFQPDTNQALSGIIEKRSASFVGTETIILSNEAIPTRRFQFDQSICWLDETDLLVVYEDQSWRITLKNHARSKIFSQ